ncbi:unnamed protein product [Scytosiphon promiscuus]
MGKKGKGTKKEDKPKKDPASSKDKLKEALEAGDARSKPTPPRATSRNTASQKNERVDAIKVGWTESFQWDNKEGAPVLPPMPQYTDPGRLGLLPIGLKQPRTALGVYYRHLLPGWQAYLAWRCLGDPAAYLLAQKSKVLKDGLSGPLTIATMVIRWALLRRESHSEKIMEVAAKNDLESGKPLHIVVVGASAGNEEKILRESDYWDDLFHLLNGRKVHLYLTGPEMSGKDGVFKRARKGKTSGNQGQQEEESKAAARRNVECWKTNGIDFFLQKGRLGLFQKEETVVVGLNSGFGVAAMHVCQDGVASQDESSNSVLWKWLPTLYFLAALDLPLMFTSSSVEDAKGGNNVLQRVVGTYQVQAAIGSPMPSETSITPAPFDREKVVSANSHFQIVQGQQPGYSFAAQQDVEEGSNALDPRINTFRKLMCKHGTWPEHVSIRKAGQQSNGIREQAPSLAPLKRYGNYPPEKKVEDVPSAASCSRGASAAVTVAAGPSNNEDGAESDSDVLAVEGGVGKARIERDSRLSPPPPLPPPEKVKLEHSVSNTAHGESNALEITVEGVFTADPETARVGVKRDSFALHYYDCRSLRDVVFEADLPDTVDHSTAEVVFDRSKRTVTVVVRLLESNK